MVEFDFDEAEVRERPIVTKGGVIGVTMAVNPQLYGNGTPVPFVDEMFVLTRDPVEFQVDNLPE